MYERHISPLASKEGGDVLPIRSLMRMLLGNNACSAVFRVRLTTVEPRVGGGRNGWSGQPRNNGTPELELVPDDWLEEPAVEIVPGGVPIEEPGVTDFFGYAKLYKDGGK